jgi:hypothetical protein
MNWLKILVAAEIKKWTKRPEPPYYSIKKSLVKEDWDFSGLTSRLPEEARACLHYELAREIPLWRQIVFNIRCFERNATKSQRGLNNVGLLFLCPHLLLVRRCPKWPKLPWQCLDSQSREKLSRVTSWDSLTADRAWMSKDELLLPKYAELKRVGKRMIVYQFLQVDLTETNRKLERDFTNYINYWRKRARIKPLRKQGQSNAIAFLKQLGALRLLKAYGFQRSAKLTQTVCEKSLYSDHSAWINAGKMAKRAIKTFEREKHLDALLGR